MSDHGHTLPPLTWTAPAGVAALAVVVLVTALGLRSRLRTPGDGRTPCRWRGWRCWARPARTSARSSAGLYAGYLVVLLPGLEFDARRERADPLRHGAARRGGLSVAGLLLERSCRVPPAASDDEVPAARA